MSIYYKYSLYDGRQISDLIDFACRCTSSPLFPNPHVIARRCVNRKKVIVNPARSESEEEECAMVIY